MDVFPGMMRFTAALVLTTAVMASLPVPLVAQAPSPSPRVPAAPQPPSPRYEINAGEGIDAEALRERFKAVMQRYPRSVGRVLRLDPTLFNDPTYMASYPDVAAFVGRYPQVARNPEYYLDDYGSYYQSSAPRTPQDRSMDLMETVLGGMAGLVVFIVVTWLLVWIVKAIVDHRRWLRVSKIQTEAHSKLLDRFSSSDELLTYIRTPAGARFLESAPLATESASSGPRAMSAPLNRILWSVQAGVVLLLGGMAVVYARNQISFEEVRQMFFMIGIVASGIGVGFILSALASYALSKRLGLLDGTLPGAAPSVPSGRVDTHGV